MKKCDICRKRSAAYRFGEWATKNAKTMRVCVICYQQLSEERRAQNLANLGTDPDPAGSGAGSAADHPGGD